LNISKLRYKGTQVAYAVVCERKLWLFSKGIALEHTSDRVRLGKVLDETSFREEEHFIDENVGLDFVKVGKEVVVHEVKLSRSLESAHRLQVLYYIYYLRHKGVKASRGVIHYPKAKRTEEVRLTGKDERLLEEALRKIDNILSLPHPPKVERKPYCTKCAYFEFCYG